MASVNTIQYFEIQADNPEQLAGFYSQIFGWEYEKDQNLPIDYWRVKAGEMPGGILKRPVAKPASNQGTNAFTCSIRVEDFDSTAKKVLELNGIEAMAKFAVPGKCWQGYFLDPEGNVFGIFEVDEQAK